MQLVNTLGISNTSFTRHSFFGNSLSRGTALAITAVALIALSNLPTADATTPAGVVLGSVCYAGCVAALTVTTGGWGAFIGFVACKAACITTAIVL